MLGDDALILAQRLPSGSPRRPSWRRRSRWPTSPWTCSARPGCCWPAPAAGRRARGAATDSVPDEDASPSSATATSSATSRLVEADERRLRLHVGPAAGLLHLAAGRCSTRLRRLAATRCSPRWPPRASRRWPTTATTPPAGCCAWATARRSPPRGCRPASTPSGPAGGTVRRHRVERPLAEPASVSTRPTLREPGPRRARRRWSTRGRRSTVPAVAAASARVGGRAGRDGPAHRGAGLPAGRAAERGPRSTRRATW